MMRLVFDVGRSGNRVEQVPKCHYDFVTIYNNTRFDFTLFSGNSVLTRDIIGACPAYTILTFPHDKLADYVNFVWAGGAGIVTAENERCKIFFTSENMGLVGEFRAPEISVVAPVIDVREIEWLTWGITTDSAANAPVTLTRTAVAGMRHIITGFEAIITGASPTIDIPIILRLGGVIFWKSFIGSGSARGTRVGFMDSKIATDINAGASIEAAAGGAGVVVTLNLSGYSR